MFLKKWVDRVALGAVAPDGDLLIARAPRALVSPATAEGLGVVEGDLVTVSSDDVRVTVPVLVHDMVDHVIWLPTNSESCDLRSLSGRAGAIVSVTKGGAA